MRKFARLCTHRTAKTVTDKMTTAPWFKGQVCEGEIVIRHVTIGQTTHFWTKPRPDLLGPSRISDASQPMPARLNLTPQIGYKL